MGEQALLVGESKGIDYQTWLDGETLYMQLALGMVQIELEPCLKLTACRASIRPTSDFLIAINYR